MPESGGVKYTKAIASEGPEPFIKTKEGLEEVLKARGEVLQIINAAKEKNPTQGETPEATTEPEENGEASEKPSYKYSDQQILLASLPTLLKQDEVFFEQPPKYYIRTTESNEIENPIQKLTKIQKQDMREILQMTNIELGSLVPKIQFWKIYYDDAGRIVDEIFMPYSEDSRNYIEDIFGNRQSR